MYNDKSFFSVLFYMLIVSIAWLVVPFSASAQPLRTLLQQLEQTHPAIQSQYEQALATQSTIKEAKSSYLPRINASANYGYQERDRDGGLGANGKTDSKPLDTSLSVTQNLFEGFRTTGSVAGAELSTLSAEAQFEAVRQQVFLQAIASYIDLLKQRHLLQLSQQNIQTLSNQVRLEQERLSAGTGIAVDVLTVKSRLQLAHERYANFLGSFQQAEARFTQFFDITPDYRTLRLPSLQPTAIPRNLPQAIQAALLKNPSLQQAEYEADAAQTDRQVARANYFPRFDVVASSNYQDSSDDISGDTATNIIQLRGSWELFSGFADKAREEQAIHSYQSSLASTEDTRRQIIESTKSNWSGLITAQQRTTILQNAVTIAQQVYTARTRLRDIGSESAINVLNAESELFSAQINAVAAQYDGYLAIYRLLQSMGLLELSVLR